MTWRSRNDKPADNQVCHIRGQAEYIVLGTVYKASADLFLALFHSPDAGTSYARERIVAWLPNEEITDPPDAFFEEVFIP